MLLPAAIPDQLEMVKIGATNSQAKDAFKIEEVLRRAREIHRKHGGVFGYDFEDWAQAWNELPQSGSSSPRDLYGENGAELISEHTPEVVRFSPRRRRPYRMGSTLATGS